MQAELSQSQYQLLFPCSPWAQGLSHYLEHMLFMGSDKFPDENEYDAFLTAHGGSSNAMTEAVRAGGVMLYQGRKCVVCAHREAAAAASSSSMAEGHRHVAGRSPDGYKICGGQCQTTMYCTWDHALPLVCAGGNNLLL
jgi:hypothetical protein